MRPIKILTTLALIVIGALFIYQFGFKKSAEDLAIKRLENLQTQIDARGDGSWLLFDAPELSGKTLIVPNVQYQDGARDVIFQAASVNATLRSKEAADIEASDIEIIPNTGSPLYISSATATNVNTGKAPLTFDQLILDTLNLEGNITSRDTAMLNINKVFLNDMNARTIDSMVFEGVTLTSSRFAQGFEIDQYQLTNINRADIETDLASLKDGKIPFSIFPLDNPKIAEGLSGLASEGLNNGSSDFEKDLFGMFSKHAPKELRDLLGNPDGETLERQLEEFQKLSPEDQVIGGLELLLKGLKSQKQDVE